MRLDDMENEAPSNHMEATRHENKTAPDKIGRERAELEHVTLQWFLWGQHKVFCTALKKVWIVAVNCAKCHFISKSSS